MPCTLPDIVVAGVFMSACASTQIRPSGCPCRFACVADAATDPAAEAVIAADDDRKGAGGVAVERLRVQGLADVADLVDVPLLRVPGVARLRRRRDDVAAILHVMAERGEPIADARDAHGRRPHVHAAASAAEIERHADQMDVGHGVALSA